MANEYAKTLLRFLFHVGYLFRVVQVKTPEQKQVFRSLWTSVWTDEGYANDKEPLHEIEEHYAVFNPWSTDLLLYFCFTPIGTIRLIWDNGTVGLPVLNDFETEKRWKGRVVEATLLTVKKGYRGRFHHLPSLILWRELYRRAGNRGMEGIVMAADVRVLCLLRRLFPFQLVGKEKFYEGSLTVPAYLSMEQVNEEFPRTHPCLTRFFLA